MSLSNNNAIIVNAKTRSDRINKLRDSDIRLLRADPDYVPRAGIRMALLPCGLMARRN